MSCPSVKPSAPHFQLGGLSDLFSRGGSNAGLQIGSGQQNGMNGNGMGPHHPMDPMAGAAGEDPHWRPHSPGQYG